MRYYTMYVHVCDNEPSMGIHVHCTAYKKRGGREKTEEGMKEREGQGEGRKRTEVKKGRREGTEVKKGRREGMEVKKGWR